MICRCLRIPKILSMPWKGRHSWLANCRPLQVPIKLRRLQMSDSTNGFGSPVSLREFGSTGRNVSSERICASKLLRVDDWSMVVTLSSCRVLSALIRKRLCTKSKGILQFAFGSPLALTLDWRQWHFNWMARRVKVLATTVGYDLTPYRSEFRLWQLSWLYVTEPTSISIFRQ